MHDELERILNEGLATYSAVEARPGLEQCVLGKVRLARRFSFAKWFSIPAIAAAAVLMWFWMMPSRDGKHPAGVRPGVAARRLPESNAGLQAKGLPRWRKPRNRPPSTELPKLEQFPTPVRQSPEEAALAAVARSHPEQLSSLNTETKPIEIPDIQITPLETGGDQETK